MNNSKRSSIIILFSFLFSSLSFCFPISLPAEDQGDIYEPDDSYASPQILGDITGAPPVEQEHTFHKFFDEDWIKIDAIKPHTYYINIESPSFDSDPIIELYSSDGTTLLKRINNNGAGGDEQISWICPEDVPLFIRIINDSIHYSSSVSYKITLEASTIDPLPGFLTGRVKNSQGVGIKGAILDGGQGTGVSLSDGTYIISLPAGPVTISVRKDGYAPGTISETIVAGETSGDIDVVLFPNSNNQSPTIIGTPGKEITVNNLYSFRPIANDDDNDSLSFSITNKPSWLSFNSENGMLLGVPNKNHVGKYGPITITVYDSLGASSQLPSFMIEVHAQGFVPLSGVHMLLLK